jgi:hypothetical protein
MCTTLLTVTNEEHSFAEDLMSGPCQYQFYVTVKAPLDKLIYNSIRAINMFHVIIIILYCICNLESHGIILYISLGLYKPSRS